MQTSWDIRNRTVVFTGGTSGIGREAVKALAADGAHLVLAIRDHAKAQLLEQELRAKHPNLKLDFIEANLDSLAEVRQLAETVKTDYPQVSVLVNNAGVFDFKPGKSKDGIEHTFAVNLLAPYLLTSLLMETLKQNGPSRIINTASTLHRGPFNFENPELNSEWTPMEAYNKSKLGLIWISRLWAQELEGSGTTINCIHPGGVATDIARHGSGFARFMFKTFGKSPAKGADSLIWLIRSPEAGKLNGAYVVKRKATKTKSHANDLTTAKKLPALLDTYLNQN